MPVDWVPVDTAVTILERVVLQPGEDAHVPQFYNVVSEAQPWTIVLESLPESARQATSRVVYLPHWVNELQNGAVGWCRLLKLACGTTHRLLHDVS